MYIHNWWVLGDSEESRAAWLLSRVVGVEIRQDGSKTSVSFARGGEGTTGRDIDLSGSRRIVRARDCKSGSQCGLAG